MSKYLEMWEKAVGTQVDRTGTFSTGYVVRCGVCGEIVDILTNVHVAKHGLTKAEYLARFPQHENINFWPNRFDITESRQGHERTVEEAHKIRKKLIKEGKIVGD